jgi:hypothetical protein
VSQPTHAGRKAALRAAIEAGVAYVLGRQAADGSWTDWELPPGASAPWTTAAVGYRLRLVPAGLSERTATARRAAADWLLANEFAAGGWGYNEAVGCDADSTASGILFLGSLRRPIRTRSHLRLAAFQRPDGGFSTYPADALMGSWGVSHSDVSAVAVLALLTGYPREDPVVARGIDYVLGQRDRGGGWNSFWWASPLYATSAGLALMRAIGVPAAMDGWSLAQATPRNAFECALLISCLADMDAPPELACALDDELVAAQLSDGSWQSERILRVTRRDCFEPWIGGDCGALFADPARLFTSATALEALSKVHAVL